MSDDLHHLAAAYALDALDETERRAFEAHYPSCDVCAQEVLEYRRTATALGQSQSVSPPSDLKASVLAEIGQTPQVAPLPDPVQRTSPRTPASQRRPVLVAAAAALLVVGGLAGIAATRLGTDNELNELVSAPDTVVAQLDSTGDAEGLLRVEWSAERDQVALFGSDLDGLGEGLIYALWLLNDDGATPAGLFRPTNGRVEELLDVADLQATGWGVTIEPAQGSPQPTTAVIFAGSL